MQDLTQLMYSKNAIQPGLISESTKQAIIHLSQLLNRDNTTIKQLPNATSEGGGNILKSNNNKCQHNNNKNRI